MSTEVKLIVPDSLEEVTLGQYQQYLSSIKGLDEEKDAEVINKKLIEAFCGIEYELVDSIPLRDIEKLLEALKMAFERDYDHTLRFDLLDVDMGFIPKLDDMSLGEYIDVEATIGDWENMHKAMAVLYRPIIFKTGNLYEIEDYEGSEKYSDVMLDAPVSVPIGANVFFYRLGKELSSHLIHSLVDQVNKDLTLRQTLEQNGVGINQFTQSLKEMSLNLKTLQNYPYFNV